jgi:hypothetical protein
MLTFALLLAAHVNQDQFGRFPFVDDEGVLFGGGTSWGVVLPDDVYGGYGRVCEESFGPVVFFALFQPTHGNRIVLGGVDGMSQTTDGGCSLTVMDNELVGEFVSAIHIDKTNPEHLIVGTSTPGSANGIWESFDGGDSFSLLREREPDVSYFGIAASDDGRIAVSGSDGNGFNVVLWSEDSGATFQDASALWFEEPIAGVLTFDGDDLIVGGLSPNVRGFVDRAQLGADPPTKTRIGSTPRDVALALTFRDELYVLSKNGVFGELLREDPTKETGFASVPGGPSDCAFVVGDVIYGCGKQTQGLNPALFLRSSDAATWETALAFVDVHYRSCPAGSRGQVGCASFIETFCGDGLDDDFDGADDCDDDDCRFNDLCAGEGEGEGEGEQVTEGEGESRPSDDGPITSPNRSACGSSGTAAVVGLGVLLRRRRLAPSSGGPPSKCGA